jgi:hypothetical protein
MEKGHVVNDSIEVKVIVLCKTGDLHPFHGPTGVAAEDDDRLRFVGVFPEVLHDCP